jgi:hypothetical protein
LLPDAFSLIAMWARSHCLSLGAYIYVICQVRRPSLEQLPDEEIQEEERNDKFEEGQEVW